MNEQTKTMNEQTKTSDSWPYLVQISFNYLGWFLCWTVATGYIVPNMLLKMVNDSEKNTRLGLMFGAANGVMLIMVPLVGTLSDRLQWRLGRRRPFYLSATFSVAILILLVARSNYYATLFALMLLMHAAYSLWLPNYALIRDTVPLQRRGRISGLANITSTLGIMFGHILAPRFIELKQMLGLALIAGSVNILSNLWVALGIREKRPANGPVQNISSWKEIYVPRLNGANSLGWLAAVNLLTQMGAVAMICFLLYFIKDQIDRVHFNETFRNVSLIATVAAILSSIVAGMVADLFGRKRVLIAACVLQIVCMLNFLVFPWVHSTLYFGGFLFGAGNGAYWSIYWTMLSDMVPEGETSKYIGLIQYTSIVPWAVVPAIPGPIVDNFGAASGKGYNILFTVIVLLLATGVLLIRQLPETLKSDSKTLSTDIG